MRKFTGRNMGKDTELCDAQGLKPLSKDSCAMLRALDLEIIAKHK